MYSEMPRSSQRHTTSAMSTVHQDARSRGVDLLAAVSRKRVGFSSLFKLSLLLGAIANWSCQLLSVTIPSLQIPMLPLTFSKVTTIHKRRPMKFTKKKIQKSRSFTGLVKELPLNGVRLAPPGQNPAVANTDQLAAEPINLLMDRFGRNLKDGEEADRFASYTITDPTRVQSAAAPLSHTELMARYLHMDKTMEQHFNGGLKQLVPDIDAKAGMDDHNVLRTFAWPGSATSGPAAIILVGVTATSELSRTVAGHVVHEVGPTGLLVQLCRERIGRHLVMPEKHLEAVANYQAGHAASNPHRIREEIWYGDAMGSDMKVMNLWMSDIAYGKAVNEFRRLPDSAAVPKLLCLGDVPSSRLEALRQQLGRSMMDSPAVATSRSKHLVRGLVSMASLGHETIVGVVDAELLTSVQELLTRTGARLWTVGDATDFQAGVFRLREDVAAAREKAIKETPKIHTESRWQQQAEEGTWMNMDEDETSLAGWQNEDVKFVDVETVSSNVLGMQDQTGLRLGAFVNQDGLDYLHRRQNFLLKVTRIKDLVKTTPKPKKWTVADRLLSSGSHLPLPGPAYNVTSLARTHGFSFDMGCLEIPAHYCRDAGLEMYASQLWEVLENRGAVVHARDPTELRAWACGS